MFDVHVWCSMFMYDVHAMSMFDVRCSCLMFDVHVWRSWSCLMFDVHVWCSMFMYDVSVRMMSMYEVIDVHVWCSCLKQSMFIHMYTYSLGPPVLHAALAPCMDNAVGSRASQGGLACILWPHHESCMHPLAPSWVFKPETPTCMSLAMTSSVPKAFIPWFRHHSAGIKVFVRITLDVLWNLEFGGIPLVVQRIWRNFVNSADVKICSKYTQNILKDLFRESAFYYNCYKKWKSSTKAKTQHILNIYSCAFWRESDCWLEFDMCLNMSGVILMFGYNFQKSNELFEIHRIF